MRPIFVDTGAWFARFVLDDSDHAAAFDWFERNPQPLITTDYVVDELLTLFRMRGEYQSALEVGPALFNGDLCRLEWVSPADVAGAWEIFSRYRDKAWSFTDCVSRVAMDRLGTEKAVAFDEHFRQFGTVAVVP